MNKKQINQPTETGINKQFLKIQFGISIKQFFLLCLTAICEAIIKSFLTYYLEFLFGYILLVFRFRQSWKFFPT